MAVLAVPDVELVATGSRRAPHADLPVTPRTVSQEPVRRRTTDSGSTRSSRATGVQGSPGT